jgi:hypothetical protein
MLPIEYGLLALFAEIEQQTKGNSEREVSLGVVTHNVAS